MAEPSDMIIPVLRELRTEIAERFSNSMATRLNALEREQRLLERALIARRAMLQQAFQRIRGRIESLEARVQQLEAQK